MNPLVGLHSRLMNVDQIQRQSIVSLGSSIGMTIVGFFTTIYFARVLGPSILGAYFLLLAYFGVFNLIGDGGIGGAAVKRISEGREAEKYFSAFVVLRVLFLVFSISALIIARPFLVDLTTAGLYSWLIIAVVVAVVFSITSGGVYGRGKVGVHQFSVFLNETSKFVIQVIAVVLGYGLAGLAGGFVAGLIIASLMNLCFLDLDLVRFAWRHVKSLFSFSFWSFLSSSGALVFTYADTILIGYFLVNADVGVYRVAFNLTVVATFT
ncbi:MAG: oligosaccharide flippase family protein, partial [Methanomicrobiaceae archaeon]|nr:oligosaccharide flippase family protein [Methanomicrobiaceae archaeon]